MSVYLIRKDERYEVDTEAEAEKLIEDAKEEGNLVKYTSTYKYLKGEERELWIVDLRRDFSE